MNINFLVGKTLSNIFVHRDIEVENRIIFVLDNDEEYVMFHRNDCCESVYIEDIIGDVNDLVGTPILFSEEISSSHELHQIPSDIRFLSLHENEESWTWTFYKLSTIKGSVTIRWYGSSNGYYSESVDFEKLSQ